MTDDLITVFGGSGFLGQDVIRVLLARGHTVRLVARHPQRPRFDRDQEKRLQRRAADIRDPRAMRDAVAGSRVVINAVSLYTQRGDLTFEAIHVRGAAGLAAAARDAGVVRLLQVSGIGATLNSPSPYIRARARGEAAVLDAFPDAVIVRPASLFGAGDALIRSLAMLSRAPVIPLFGRGLTRLQPVWVEDVAGALARLADHTAPAAGLYELGGAETLRYRALVAAVPRPDPRVALPPVPVEGKMKISALSLFRTLRTPSRAGCRIWPKSGDRWSIVGMSHALRRLSGMLVGPGMKTGFRKLMDCLLRFEPNLNGLPIRPYIFAVWGRGRVASRIIVSCQSVKFFIW